MTAKQPIAHLIGIAVAVIGGGFAVVSFTNTRAQTPGSSPVEVPESVRSALANANSDTVPTVPTATNIDEVAAQLRARVLSRLEEVPTLSSISESVRVDLADAFVERWRALIDPDLKRDYQTLAARGDPRPLPGAAAEYEDYREWMDSLSMSPGGLDRVVVTDGATPAALASAAGVAAFEGFRRGMSSRNKDKMPVPDSPVDAGWRSVQIVMPFAPAGSTFQTSPPGNEGSSVTTGNFWDLSFYWASLFHDIAPWDEHFATWVVDDPRRDPDRPWLSGPFRGQGVPSFYYCRSMYARPAMWSGRPVTNIDDLRAPVRTAQVRFPGSKVFLFDGEAPTRAPANQRPDTISMAFVDGHAARHRRSDATEPVMPASNDVIVGSLHDTKGGSDGRDYD
jgi:hypothetical protein